MIIGVGPLGHQVAGELQETASALDPAAPVSRVRWDLRPRSEGAVRREVQAALDKLLARGGAEARLDVLVLGEVTDTTSDAFAAALHLVAEVLASGWPVLLPADAAPADRTVWGVAALVVPPMKGSHALPAIRALRALEGHRQTARHPLFSRALILPRQTRALALDDEGAAHALRAVALGLYASGARRTDMIRSLVAHRTDDRWLQEVSSAVAEVPLAPLVRYAAQRVALDALDELVARAERPTGDPSRAEALVARLGADDLLHAFMEGEAAARLRRHAAALSGATDALPADLRVRWFERDPDLNARFRLLLGPAARPPPDRATEHPEHGEILRLLDREEAFAIAELARRVDVLLTTELEPGTALEVLPHLEAALARARHRLEERGHSEVPTLPPPDPPPPPRDEGRERIASAVRYRARPGALAPLALAFGLVVGAASLWIGTAVADPRPDPGAIVSGAAPGGAWIGLAGGSAVALAVAVGLTIAWLIAGQLHLFDALRARRDELEALWRQGGGGQPGRQAQAVLAVRLRRAAAGLAFTLRRGAERLEAARAALRVARDEAAAALERLRVRRGAAARQDDLRALLGQDGPLRVCLAAPGALAEALANAREVSEPPRLAQALLEATWPPGGLVDDLPDVQGDRARAACAALAGARAPSLWTAAARTDAEGHIVRFWRAASAHLASGLDPRDPHGERLPRPETWLVVAPAAWRPALAEAVESRPLTLLAHPQGPPWIIVLVAGPPLALDEIARGTS